MTIDDLTKKQKEFVKEYIDTGNGTQAALKVYDTDSPRVAASIAHENLTKPDIVNAIQDALPDTLLAVKHKELFEQKQIAYFTFPKDMPEQEIIEHVENNGLTVINIGWSKNGRLAFYTIPDANAIKGALDMAYKLKGSYAPAKHDVKQEMVDGLTDEEKEKLKRLVK